MAKHLIVMSVVMEDMDGTPEQSAEILATDWVVLRDYWNAGEIEFTAEEVDADTMVLHRGTGTYFALSEAEFVDASEVDDL